jgi:hypothetical protein
MSRWAECLSFAVAAALGAWLGNWLTGMSGKESGAMWAGMVTTYTAMKYWWVK